MQACEFALVSKVAYTRLLKAQLQRAIGARMDVLKALPFLSVTNHNMLQRVATNCQVRLAIWLGLAWFGGRAGGRAAQRSGLPASARQGQGWAALRRTAVACCCWPRTVGGGCCQAGYGLVGKEQA